MRTEDEIARYYWPKDSQPSEEPAEWFRAAISDAFDSGIAFAVRRSADGNQPPRDVRGDPGAPRTVNGEARDE